MDSPNKGVTLLQHSILHHLEHSLKSLGITATLFMLLHKDIWCSVIEVALNYVLNSCSEVWQIPILRLLNTYITVTIFQTLFMLIFNPALCHLFGFQLQLLHLKKLYFSSFSLLSLVILYNLFSLPHLPQTIILCIYLAVNYMVTKFIFSNIIYSKGWGLSRIWLAWHMPGHCLKGFVKALP